MTESMASLRHFGLEKVGVTMPNAMEFDNARSPPFTAYDQGQGDSPRQRAQWPSSTVHGPWERAFSCATDGTVTGVTSSRRSSRAR